MEDTRGDFLGPPHGTTPAAVRQFCCDLALCCLLFRMSICWLNIVCLDLFEFLYLEIRRWPFFYLFGLSLCCTSQLCANVIASRMTTLLEKDWAIHLALHSYCKDILVCFVVFPISCLLSGLGFWFYCTDFCAFSLLFHKYLCSCI